jgi:hypothetical protein
MGVIIEQPHNVHLHYEGLLWRFCGVLVTLCLRIGEVQRKTRKPVKGLRV